MFIPVKLTITNSKLPNINIWNKYPKMNKINTYTHSTHEKQMQNQKYFESQTQTL